MSILSNNVRLIRKELRCPQSAMAKILGVGFRSYVRYEAGERDAPVSALVKLAYLGNISLEQLLTKVISSHDISPVSLISDVRDFPETKLVDFRKGEIIFKRPDRQELMSVDSSEKRLLSLFRKMDGDLKKVCLENIKKTDKVDKASLDRVGRRIKFDRSGLNFSKTDILTKKKSQPSIKKENKKLLKEKIDRLKMIANSINSITVK